MGLPLVTLTGQTFSSRMAGSLLHAMGLERGIAGSLDEYIERAVRLGTHPGEYRAYREACGGDAWRRTIGNIEAFVPEYEERLLSVLTTPTRNEQVAASRIVG